MKLEYKILWIDNDLPAYIENGSVKDIEDFLLEKGFEPTIEKVFDEADLDNFITKHDYDLIISDYNLNNTTGDTVIKQIREERKSDAEILFYTAQDSYMNNEQVMKNLAFKERLTFKVGRNGLIEKIETVIELTLKKLLELNATRGLITAATSELDVEIEEIYYQLIEIPVDDETKPKLQKIFQTDYKEMKKNYLKQCKAKRDNHASDFKMYFSISDSFRRYDILKEFLKLKTFDNFDLDLFKKYNSEVIEIRNKFAHAKAFDDNGVLKLKGRIEGQDFEFTDESCVEIRKNLIAHKKNIEILKTIIIHKK